MLKVKGNDHAIVKPYCDGDMALMEKAEVSPGSR